MYSKVKMKVLQSNTLIYDYKINDFNLNYNFLSTNPSPNNQMKKFGVSKVKCPLKEYVFIRFS